METNDILLGTKRKVNRSKFLITMEEKNGGF